MAVSGGQYMGGIGSAPINTSGLRDVVGDQNAQARQMINTLVLPQIAQWGSFEAFEANNPDQAWRFRLLNNLGQGPIDGQTAQSMIQAGAQLHARGLAQGQPQGQPQGQVAPGQSPQPQAQPGANQQLVGGTPAPQAQQFPGATGIFAQPRPGQPQAPVPGPGGGGGGAPLQLTGSDFGGGGFARPRTPDVGGSLGFVDGSEGPPRVLPTDPALQNVVPDNMQAGQLAEFRTDGTLFRPGNDQQTFLFNRLMRDFLSEDRDVPTSLNRAQHESTAMAFERFLKHQGIPDETALRYRQEFRTALDSARDPEILMRTQALARNEQVAQLSPPPAPAPRFSVGERSQAGDAMTPGFRPTAGLAEPPDPNTPTGAQQIVATLRQARGTVADAIQAIPGLASMLGERAAQALRSTTLNTPLDVDLQAEVDQRNISIAQAQQIQQTRGNNTTLTLGDIENELMATAERGRQRQQSPGSLVIEQGETQRAQTPAQPTQQIGGQRASQLWEQMQQPSINADQILQTVRGSEAYQTLLDQVKQRISGDTNAVQAMISMPGFSRVSDTARRSMTEQQYIATIDELKSQDTPIGAIMREFDTLGPHVLQQIIHEAQGNTSTVVNHLTNPTFNSGSTTRPQGQPQAQAVPANIAANPGAPGQVDVQLPERMSQQMGLGGQTFQQAPQAPAQPSMPEQRINTEGAPTLRGLQAPSLNIEPEQLAQDTVRLTQNINGARTQEATRLLATMPELPEELRRPIQGIADGQRPSEVFRAVREAFAPKYRDLIRQGRGTTAIREDLNQRATNLFEYYMNEQQTPTAQGTAFLDLAAPELQQMTLALRQTRANLKISETQEKLTRETVDSTIRQINAQNDASTEVNRQNITLAKPIFGISGPMGINLAKELIGLQLNLSQMEAMMAGDGGGLDFLKLLVSMNPMMQHLPDNLQNSVYSMLFTGLTGQPHGPQKPEVTWWNPTTWFAKPEVAPLPRPQLTQAAQDHADNLSRQFFGQ
jgi:hypothetical protein